jgi:hypothetical protein
VLRVAAIIDGRLTRAERRLLVEAMTVCRLVPDLGPVERLRKAFIDGDPIDPANVTRLA